MDSPIRPPFPTYIDNSMRVEFVKCPRAFFFKYILRRAPSIPSIHLHAGAAFAKGLEVTRLAFYDEGCDKDTAIAKGYSAVMDSYGPYLTDDGATKTALRMAQALVYYFSIYNLQTDFIKPLKRNGKSMVEVNFTTPLEIDHPESKEPLILCGRFDMLGEADGVIYIDDEKTASQLGPTWGNKFLLASQFSTYAYGARQFNYPIGGVLIRGVSILKNGFDHAQKIIYRPDWQVDRWKVQFLRDVQSMIDCWESGYWDYNLADACGMYGGCDFLPVCQSRPEDELKWLMGPEFTANTHNPLERHK